MLIVAVLVAVFTVGYAFAWYVERKDSDFKLTGASAGAYFDFTSGDGTTPEFGENGKGPFIIANATHMRNLAVLQNTGRFGTAKYYFKIKDTVNVLDMGPLWLPPIGTDDNPFIGEFDGNGKTIANLKVTTDKVLLTERMYPTQASAAYDKFSQAVGLFGNTGESSNIHNFILNNPHVVVGTPGVNNNKYSTALAKTVGIAVGHVAGKCSSIGVRATDAGANTDDGVGSTTLDVRVIGYSTFNSILGELAEGVNSSITGGGHVAGSGSGGSGNAFGANIDINGLVDRLVAIHDNNEASWYLPRLGDYYLNTAQAGSKGTTLASMEKMPFTVGADSTYVGATARETLAINNIGYALGNQTKFYSKTYNFGAPMTLVGNTYQHTDKVIPQWIYKRIGNYGADYSTSNLKALTASEMAALPQNLKNAIFPAEGETSKTLDSIAISQTFNNVGAQIYPGTDSNDQWSPHGQISWNGNTYGLGFSKTDYKGNAVDENGKLYAANGNYIGDDGYDVDENGIYAVDPSSYPDFPYVVYSVGTTYPNEGVAYDSDGNAYYRYNPGNSGLYVYGVLQDGYLRTGNNYQYYVAPIAGWDQPIPLIDANGYAMYASGVYYDASGNIVDGAYVKDTNGLYIASDANFSMPISQIVNGYAQDADGNYYGAITLNGQTVYCYLGSDGTTSGYSGWYRIDGNNFLVPVVNVDANGNIKYNDTDFYGSLNGQKGYVDANGYFYDDRHAYVVTDGNVNNLVTLVDADGYAMVNANKYYGRLKENGVYSYAYLIKRGDKFYWYSAVDCYQISDKTFTQEIRYIDDEGNAMYSEDVYYGRYRKDGNSPWSYGQLFEAENGKTYFKIDGKFIIDESNVVDQIDKDGYAMFDDTYYYGRYEKYAYSWDYAYLKLDNNNFVFNDDGYLFDLSGWQMQGYKVCEDPNDDNYGYLVSTSTGELYINGVDGKPVKGFGYRLSSNNKLLRKNEDTGEWEEFKFTGSNGGQFDATPMPGTKVKVLEGEKFKVQEGEPISVEQGEIDKAIADSEINGLEGQFITPKEIEKIKVVTETVGANDKLEKVLAKQSQPIALYRFLSGVALPNNGIWFKPSIAGTIRILLFAEDTGKGITLIQGHRPSATKENPFIVDYSINGGDITAKEVAKCDLPAYVLCYFEYTISQEEIDDGRYEYWIIKNDSGGGAGANFVYLDLGASAPDDDTSAVVPDTVSAVDFIYDGVEISQENVANTDIKIGDFIVNNSGTVARYDSSKTSVYFDGITKALKVVYVRLHNESGKHSDKTICLEYTKESDLDEVYATYATYVCPDIKGGTGTVGGGGGGTDIPDPDTPDDVAVTGVTLDKTSLSLAVGGTAPLNASVSPSNATNKTVTWSSSDTNVATVDSSGKVTAKAAGTVTITVTTADGNKTATCEVTVTGGSTSSGSNLLTSVSATNKNTNFIDNTYLSAQSTDANIEKSTVSASAFGMEFTDVVRAASNKCSITFKAKTDTTIAIYYCVTNGTTVRSGDTVTVTYPSGVTGTITDSSGSDTANIHKLVVTLTEGQEVTLKADANRMTLLALYAE